MWSRRQFLSALGASGASCALAPLLGCGASAPRSTKEPLTRLGDEQLLTALSILDPKLDDARIFSRQNTSDHVVLDHEREEYQRNREHLVVLSGQRDGVASSIVLLNPDYDELLLAATQLSGHAVARPMQLGPLEQVRKRRSGIHRHSEYRDPVRTILAQAQEHGLSRIIYRSSYLHSVHSEQRLISRSQNLRFDSQRTRAGLVMAAWARGEIATSDIQVSGQGGPALVRFSAQDLESVADQTLAHLYARSAPSGAQDVLLCPEAAAMLAYHGIAKARATLPADYQGAARVVDDPRVGYGAMTYDDEGLKAAPQILLGTGAGPAPVSGRSRIDAEGVRCSRPCHVRVEPGEHSLADLVANVKTGVLLEGPELCVLDSRGETVSLLASRGREIRDGRFTGRLFARTLSRLQLSEFLSTTSGLGNASATLAFDDRGIASSAQAPHWLGRAHVEAA